MIMARANRAAEQEAVAELVPEPGDDVLVAGFGPGVGMHLLAGRLTGGRIVGMPFNHMSLAGAARSRNPGRLVGRGRAPRARKPDSGHIGTVSLTDRVRRASRNAMKPRIQCVLTQWNPGFTTSGSRPSAVEPRFHYVR
jgi:hypothetical protein